MADNRNQPAFRRYAWAVLAYNVLVVLFGAYVRASGSGAGCGAHWPLCNGEVVPRAPRLETIIEFSHRVSSGLALVSVAVLLAWAFKAFPRKHRARWWAVWSTVFILSEAALGAGLVLLRYVDQNASVGRAIYLSLHLTNTQLLLASITLAAVFARLPEPRLRFDSRFGFALAALPVALVVSVSGVVAALGDTLYPASSFEAGLSADFSPTASLLVRLRVFHPGLAVLAGSYMLFAVLSTVRLMASVRRTATLVAAAVLLQLGAGALNVALLAPVWMQIAHLLLADVLWVLLVLLAVQAAQSDQTPGEAEASRARTSSPKAVGG